MSERKREITSIFHSAIGRESHERGPYLDGACGGDEALRREVEALIKSHENARSFIDSPAYERGAELLTGHAGALTGRSFGQYRLISFLGGGGMGEVYLAQDTRLDRRVALKVLPPNLTADRTQFARFQQEARAASALNHPNIITIYEINEAAGTHYIATEYIEGMTLQKRLLQGELTLREAVELAEQIANALNAAHSAGVVHRDIKPENVMLRPDGYVKVLDFGIAKLMERQRTAPDAEAATRALVQTRKGAVVGTPQYMSPEQARGVPVDARTDIWSLGVVLYELVAGQVPFAGETANDCIASILKTEPAPLTAVAPTAPLRLEWIVLKALRKDRDERYQTAKELLSDLRAVNQEVEASAQGDRLLSATVSPNVEAQAGTTAGSGQQAVAIDTSNHTTTAAAAHTTSSAEYLATEIKRHKVAAIVLLIVVAAGIVVLAAYLRARNTEGAIESIAVLPFTNQNHDPDSEYLADGLTESIINSLTQLPNLKVIARSSVFHYKGKATDPMAIGKELGVRAVLNGRIIQRGDNLTISAELMDVRDNKQLWGEQYERKVSDVLAVQREIAKEISSNLRLKVSGAEQSRVTRHYTDNPEAYRLYLKGRYFFNKFTPADHQLAIGYFEQAIAKDPTYALAYTGLADTYGASSTNGWIVPSEGIPKAKAAANRALGLDETLVEAHISLGAIKMFYDLDWVAAEREYKRVMELDPNNSITAGLYSYVLCATGRLDEGIKMARRGLETDPLSVPRSDDTGQAYYLAGRYDEAVKQYGKSLELDPNNVAANMALGMVYEQQGRYDYAIIAYQKAINASERTSQMLAVLGHAYAVSGRRGEALKILSELTEMSRQKYVSPYDLAVLYTGLGEKDRAIAELNKAYEERSGWIIFLKVEPLFHPLRSDPRFANIVHRMGL